MLFISSVGLIAVAVIAAIYYRRTRSTPPVVTRSTSFPRIWRKLSNSQSRNYHKPLRSLHLDVNTEKSLHRSRGPSPSPNIVDSDSHMAQLIHSFPAPPQESGLTQKAHGDVKGAYSKPADGVKSPPKALALPWSTYVRSDPIAVSPLPLDSPLSPTSPQTPKSYASTSETLFSVYGEDDSLIVAQENGLTCARPRKSFSIFEKQQVRAR